MRNRLAMQDVGAGMRLLPLAWSVAAPPAPLRGHFSFVLNETGASAPSATLRAHEALR